jgi:hypothetical protein
MFKPYSSTGRGGKLPVRFRFALGRRSRAAEIVWGREKQKRICQTMMAAGREMKHRKGKGMMILAKLPMPELPLDMLSTKQADAWLQVHPMPMDHLPGMVVGLTPLHWSPQLTAR